VSAAGTASSWPRWTWPINPEQLLQRVLDGDLQTLGEAIVAQLPHVWDTSGGGAFVAAARSVANHEQAARMMVRVRHADGVQQLPAGSADGRPARRAVRSICRLAWPRYRGQARAAPPRRTSPLAAIIGPNLQRYLTEPLP